MSVTKKDLLKDFERALEFDQSALFKKIYEEEYGTFGGAPYGALIGDFEFGNHPQDMALLERISQVAAAAHAPFLSAASARNVWLGHILGNDRSSRHLEDLRPHGVYEMAKLPRIGGFTLRRPDAAARADA